MFSDGGSSKDGRDLIGKEEYLMMRLVSSCLIRLGLKGRIPGDASLVPAA